MDSWLSKARVLPEFSGITEYLQEAEPDQALPLFLSNCIHVLLNMPGIGNFQAVPNELIRGLVMRVQGENAQITIPTAPYMTARQRFADREYFMENLMVSLFFELKMRTSTSADNLWKSYVNFCNLYSIYRFMAVMSCREGGGRSG